MLKNKKLFLIAIMACVISSLGAQTNSPYSRYGYGVLRDQVTGPSKGMGGIGYGLRNSLSANPINPASYSRVDSLTFLFDMGVSGSRAKLSDESASRNDYNGGLDYITTLMPLSKRVGFSLGILPYSTIGYDFGSKEKAGTVEYTKAYSGSGGLSQVYAGLGYLTPIDGLSVGVNASFLFGTLDQTRSVPSIGATSNLSTEYSELTIKTFKFDIGVQYEMAVSKDNNLVLGAVFTPGINSTGNYQNIHHEVNSSTGYPITSDTLSVNGVDAGLPTTLGAGFTLTHKQKLIVGADVTYQDWSSVKYSSLMGDGLDKSNRFNDRWKYAAGIEYTIDPMSRNFFHRMKLRGGGNYSNSYLNVKDTNGNVNGYNEYGATIGFGLPLRDRESFGNRTSYLNINFEYKKIDPKAGNLVKEEYFGISVNVNINELWFYKKKIQ